LDAVYPGHASRVFGSTEATVRRGLERIAPKIRNVLCMARSLEEEEKKRKKME